LSVADTFFQKAVKEPFSSFLLIHSNSPITLAALPLMQSERLSISLGQAASSLMQMYVARSFRYVCRQKGYLMIDGVF
jgi:hypothetical protein